MCFIGSEVDQKTNQVKNKENVPPSHGQEPIRKHKVVNTCIHVNTKGK
jgi:hypothetical protein